MAQLRINARQVQRICSRLTEMGRNLNDLSEPMNLIGIRLQGTREEIFEAQGDPVKWQPSQRALREGGITLVDTRSLLNSLTTRVADGVVFDVRPRSVEVGSRLRHAPLHDEGATFIVRRRTKSGKTVTFRVRMPQRRFTNIRPADRKAITEVIETWMLGLFDEVVA